MKDFFIVIVKNVSLVSAYFVIILNPSRKGSWPSEKLCRYVAIPKLPFGIRILESSEIRVWKQNRLACPLMACILYVRYEKFH